jgi:hypothetical protein
LQLLEQHVTSSQHLSHFFLHVNGRPQTAHIFSGKLDLLGFFSLLAPSDPPPPLRPNSLHDDASLRDDDDDGAGCRMSCCVGPEFRIVDLAMTRGERKVLEDPMAQLLPATEADSAQNDRISLMMSGI